jgi:hypothetical protein
MTGEMAFDLLMRIAEAYRAEHDAIRDPCDCGICMSAAMCGVPTRGRKINVPSKVFQFIYKQLDLTPGYAGPASAKPRILYAVGYATTGTDNDGESITDYAMVAGPVPDIGVMKDFCPDSEPSGTPMVLKLSGDPFKEERVVFTPLYQWADGKWVAIDG